MTDAQMTRFAVPDSAPHRLSTLQHVTVETGDDLATCTMFPQDHTAAVATEWLTANSESFVSLEDAR
ncbi:hypothetical protein D8Y22_14220 [Salinadaptatus halalkaliphilus]|uniref:DUF7511 domain-containing protein n=1 Tax=Salinadaptatus halalkaliphilus TaxID=2419781 RepID=A0A4S3TMF4_9EURY|nr:hypothetical protein [Salinadaptatus halalkaliphilus]THE64215.1 hypothetical protein D8Y22_14220 [Salinadaptatus halalkaliphilus]